MADKDLTLDYLKRATQDLRRLRHRVRELEEAATEPIAIVAMGCRYAGGVSSPEDLWRLVADGVDAIGPFPTDRGWDLTSIYGSGVDGTFEGGFLYGAGGFDAGFFGMSPREAIATDPQQRLLLEVAWETFERAGINPAALRGSATGVYVGATQQGYGLQPTGDATARDGYLVTGTTSSVASGRVSYVFGLEGPAVTVDTACSSSLVALHLAVQALRAGECSLALAGGVAVMPTTGVFAEFSLQGGQASNGRCKAFAAAADGAGWGEGAGLVLLERLSDAQRLGHPVLAVVRGSAVNQDGASNGLTAPNGPSQQRVIRQALANAGVEPSDVDVVEAHGTGTTLGDPIEAQALLATYGQGREVPLWLGSVKSNIGHTQAAAGVAGVIKMVMALRHGVLPGTLHVDEPTPHVDWSAGAVQLLTGARPWPDVSRARRAGVSSFGVSGTNVHLILEEHQSESTADSTAAIGDVDRAGGAVPWVLSGRGQAALRAQAARLGEFAVDTNVDPRDVAWTLATTRADLTDRAVVLGRDRDELLRALGAVAGGESSVGVVCGSVVSGKTVFVFPGQGSQWVGMAAELYAASPVFAGVVDKCVGIMQPMVDWDVAAAIRGGGDLARVDVVQPLLFIVMVGLSAVWRSYGVEPAAVVGHSQGEIAAAFVAGVLPLQDAIRVVVARSQALCGVAGSGGMATVFLPADEVAGRIGREAWQLSVAAVNSPFSTVVSGSVEALDLASAVWGAERVRVSRIDVDYASHSAGMDAIDASVRTGFDTPSVNAVSVPMMSTVTGEWLDPTDVADGYWFRNLREQVRLTDAVTALVDQGFTKFVEMSPHPILTAAIQDTVEDVVTVGSLRRDDGGLDRLLYAVAEAHVFGVPVDWSAVLAGTGQRSIDLPTYAFQRERYWLEPRTSAGDARGFGLAVAEHPLLGAAVELADGSGVVLAGRVSLSSHPWLADHQVLGSVLLPGTAFLELVIHAGDQVGLGQVEELTLEAPLLLREGLAVQLQVRVSRVDGSVGVHSRPDGASEWTRHAHGTVTKAAVQDTAELVVWPPAGAERVDVTDVYRRFTAIGLDYGPAFQGLTSVWRVGEHVYGEVVLPEEFHADAALFGLHPALLDAALHTLVAAPAWGGGDAAKTWLPFVWSGVVLHRIGATALRVRLTQTGTNSVSVLVADQWGEVVAAVDSLTLLPATPEHGAAGALFAVEWVAVAAEPATAPTALVGDDSALAGGLGMARTYRDLAELAQAMTAGTEPMPEVVYLPLALPHPETDVPEAVRATLDQCLRIVRQWVTDEVFASATLVLVTRGVAEADSADPRRLAGSALWGMVRSAQAEHPERLVLLDIDEHPDSFAVLAGAVAAGEPQLMIRGGAVSARRILPARGDRDVTANPAPHPLRSNDGVVLVTGGLGALGAVAARHLVVEHGVRRLALTGRKGLATDGATDLVAELTSLGAQVDVYACDVGDRDAVAGLLDQITSLAPLTAVIHSAGVLDDGVVLALNADRFDTVLRPKVDGAWHLHELTRGMDLSAFVLFSSAAGVMGSQGQSNYAAANAFLDALAEQRRFDGHPAVSIAWGLWAGPGLTSDLTDMELARIGRAGMRALSASDGQRLLDAAVTADEASVLAMDFNLGRATVDQVPPLLRGLARNVVQRARASQADADSLATRLSALTESEQRDLVLQLVRAQAATVLGHASGEQIGVDTAFKQLGFDSLTAVELRNRLAAATGLKLPPTLIFDYPSAQVLSDHLHQLVRGVTADIARPVVTTASSDEPVAIVGMGCRFPGGVVDPEGLWDVVAGGVDALSGFPGDRGWDIDGLYGSAGDASATSRVTEGGFVDGAGDFDAAFFGMSASEALATDPQQRLLLEVAWETFERAGIDPAALRGSATGIFTGLLHQGYGMQSDGVPAGSEGYLFVGTLSSVASGRVSYALGLEGPAVTVDTACSSALVAMHLAAQSLRSGECSLALAGGVTVMVSPTGFAEFSRQGGLAADGRCKPFATAADGTNWGEGVGLVLLERLSDARRNGHEVLAVLKGSAVNQDGASNGLTAPNGPSQQRVIRQALANAGVEPSDVDVVEAHGTGTTLGDPIEAQALLATYGQGREVPLWLGSVKSNIGHTQAAAGVAGVIKMVMALRHGVLPGTLHVDEPTPHVDWSAGAVSLLTEARPWLRTDRPRRAGVSSFGISGTNAHVIIEEASAEPTVGRTEPATVPGLVSAGGVVPWIVSGRIAEALTEQVVRLGEFVTETGPALVDVGWSLASTRTAFSDRAVVLGRDRDELLTALGGIARGETPAGAARGSVRTTKTVFVFPGQGSQWVGMAAELYAVSPVFAGVVDECVGVMQPLVDWDVAAAIRGGGDLGRVDVVQPLLFVVMVGLAAVWRSYGVEPGAVVGHSQGEIAAAYVAGVLSLEDAIRVVVARSQALRGLAGSGGMATVFLPADEVAGRIDRAGWGLSVAAVNSPFATVVSGPVAALDQATEAWTAEGVRVTRIDVDYASHSAGMDAIDARVRTGFETPSVGAPRVPMMSTVTGAWLDPAEVADGYWFRNLREQVRLTDAVTALAEQGYGAFVEMSPHPILTAAIQDTVEDVVTVGSLRRDDGGLDRLLRSFAEAYVHGIQVDWRAVFAGSGGSPVELPTYAFQHDRYWLRTGGVRGDLSGVGLDRADHPLLAASVDLFDGDVAFTGQVSAATHPWLADHRVLDTVLFPATAYLELVLHAGAQIGLPRVESLTVETPLVLPERDAIQLQVHVSRADGAVSVHSRSDSEPDWIRHAHGTLTADATEARAGLTAWPPAQAESVDVQEVYERLAEGGFECGPVFQGLRTAWRVGSDIYAEVALPTDDQADAAGFGVHPALLDAVLHASGGVGTQSVGWSGVSLYQSGLSSLRVKLTTTAAGIALTVADERGDLVATVDSLVPGQTAGGASGALLRREWVSTAVAAAAAGTCAVVGGDSALADGLKVAGHNVSAYATLADLIRVVEAGTAAVPEVVYLSAEPVVDPDAPVPVQVRVVADGWQRVVREWLGTDVFRSATLVLVTGDVLDVVTASGWGLVRSVQQEHPGRLVLAGMDGQAESYAVLPGAVATGEPEFVVRAGTAFVVRLSRIAGVRSGGADLGGGAVLVTGGLDALGAEVSRYLVRELRVERLVLTGREGMATPGAEHLARELTRLGAHVEVHAGDVVDREVLANVTAVVHAAGDLDGGWQLHELTRDLDLTAFVLFSSMSGEPASSTANAFLDALALRRRAEKLPAVSIGWGPWADSEVVPEHTDYGWTTGTGVRTLSTVDGLRLLGAAIEADEVNSVAIELDLRAMRASTASGEQVVPLLRELVRHKPRAQRTDAGGSVLAERLTRLTEADRRAVLLDAVRAEVAAILGWQPEKVPADRLLVNLGFGSLTAVELRNRLNAITGLRLPPTLAFDHPTIGQLADHLAVTIAATTTTTVQSSQTVAKGPLEAVFEDACARGKGVEAFDFLMAVSRLRPSFGTDLAGVRVEPPTRLTEGSGTAHELVFLPPPIALQNVYQYARFADSMPDGYGVSRVALPGFAEGELVPADLEAAAAYFAAAVEPHVSDRPYSLVGHSSGGWLAWAAAERLTRDGHGPHAVILLDTPLPQDSASEELVPRMEGHRVMLRDRFGLPGDQRLTASGAYYRLYLDWKPSELQCSLLFVQAQDSFVDALSAASHYTAEMIRSATAVIQVPGDHWSIVDDHAPELATAITRWLASSAATGPSGQC